MSNTAYLQIVTYSPKYARYQKTIREKQVERAEKMIASGNTKKQRKNPNDPGRFIGTVAVTDDGEAAKIHSFLDENKIAVLPIFTGITAILFSTNCQRQEYATKTKITKINIAIFQNLFHLRL